MAPLFSVFASCESKVESRACCSRKGMATKHNKVE